MVTEAGRGAQDVVQLQVCFYRAPATRMGMHSVRLSCMMSVTCGPARVCESLPLTRAVYRSASQKHRRVCWIVDYINNIEHTPLESRRRHVLGSASPTLSSPRTGPVRVNRAPAAAGSAQCGELLRSNERHPRQGCWGRARCEGAGCRGPWAALGRDRAQPSPRRLRI